MKYKNVLIIFIIVMISSLALSRDEKNMRAYIVTEGTNEVWVIDQTTKELITKIGVGKSPHGIAIGPKGTYHDKDKNN